MMLWNQVNANSSKPGWKQSKVGGIVVVEVVVECGMGVKGENGVLQPSNGGWWFTS